MRRALLSLTACLSSVTVACKSISPIHLQPTIEESQSTASALRVNEIDKSSQLLRGFYDLQSGVWRWTAPQFAVLLASPVTAKTRGARLVLDFNLPGPSIATLKNVTVTASINHVPLAPQTFSTPGSHRYLQDAPPSAFSAQDATVEFSVDKFVTPPNDGRNLALVVTAVALEPK